MSYARFGWDGSDVYVFVSVGGWIECCACWLIEEEDEYLRENGQPFGFFHAYSTQEMVDHLNKHKEAGHCVPEYVFDRLWEEHEENMEYIAKERAERDN